MRVLIGGIIQESNTFSPMVSTMDDFRRYQFFLGEEVLGMTAENELKGFLQAVQEFGIDVVPTISANAVSSGVFARNAFNELKQLLGTLLQAAPEVDGAYLALHGAMVAEGEDDAGAELIEIVRRHIGTEKPLVISLDLHANVTERMIRGVDGIVGYRTFPHVDFASTGYRSAKLLHSILQGSVSPAVAMRKIPMIVPAENSQTSQGPFADMWQEAEAGERRGDALVTSLFPVQPWLDIDEMGSSVVVVGPDGDTAAREADRLAELFWRKRYEFGIDLYTVGGIVEKVLEQGTDGGPYIISDSADSPGAGATGDSNFVLKELLELGVQERLNCLLTMVDASAVARAIEAGVGSQLELEVGYTVNPNRAHGSPLRIKGLVKRIGDGKFSFSGGYTKGSVANMGRCVVLQIGKISLLLGEQPVFTGDPGMYRTMGLEPLEADIVLVKSANQFRADYERLSRNIFILDTPGCSPTNIRSLPFKKLQRPCYPFDDDFDWGKSR